MKAKNNPVGDTENNLEAVVALAKRRGFIFQGSEIYGGLAGTWDWGPLGVALKNNIKQSWWKRFVESREDIFPVDTAILMNQKVWQASGHVGGFADPLVECNKCHKSFRADHVPQVDGVATDVCPECGKGKLEARQPFNMMFKTQVGVGGGNDSAASERDASVSYLRPETAQGMFVNFKNIIDSLHPRLPFGMAQIGKAFRNEIAPRDFLFRVREFEQMEIEYFIRESDWEKTFEMWRVEMKNWLAELGLGGGDASGGKSGENAGGKVHELEVAAEDRAHYSKRTIDFEFDFPFGRKELCGLAYRTDFDLRNHSTASGVDLSYFDEQTGERFIPHVIEPTVGVDRLALALLCS
ncbi:MAG: glycine--tRNA ligase, partial [Patescibacteria group bacterium]